MWKKNKHDEFEVTKQNHLLVVKHLKNKTKQNSVLVRNQ